MIGRRDGHDGYQERVPDCAERTARSITGDYSKAIALARIAGGTGSH